MIKVPCPRCGVVLKAPDNAAGRVVACPKCGNQARVPGGAAPTGGRRAAMGGVGGRVPCPSCGELIPAVSRKCRYCGSFVEPSVTGRHIVVKSDTARHPVVGNHAGGRAAARGDTGRHAAVRGDSGRNPAVRGSTGRHGAVNDGTARHAAVADDAAAERVPCPVCGEMIAATAQKCRFCGEVIVPAVPAPRDAAQVVPTDSDAGKSTRKGGKLESERGFFSYLFRFYFSKWWKCKGRATRREYWHIWGFLTGLRVLAFLLLVINAAVYEEKPPEALVATLGAIGLFCLVSGLPFLALVYRRCHDANKRGTLEIVAILLMRFLERYAGKFADGGTGMAFAILFAATGLALEVFVGVRRGTVGENKYGADPYEGESPAPAVDDAATEEEEILEDEDDVEVQVRDE